MNQTITSLFKHYKHSSKERFLRYVQIDTQSDPTSDSVPSTAKQKDLGNILVDELLTLGIIDAHLDEYGYVYATIPSNIDKKVPVICFCAHMDTSPDCSGTNVRPILHQNYQGQDLVLPDDNSVVIRSNDHPELKSKKGHDIITASGTTLLGADNKAGVAAIMDAVAFLIKNPQVLHGTIKILFTPDEEIGRGVNHIDMKKLGADFGYTIDGEALGSLENETFSADAAILTIYGKSAHPGFAKGNMISALKVLAQAIANLPPDQKSPETTSDKEGFIHPVKMEGTVEKASAEFIIRDFQTSKLPNHVQLIRTAAEQAVVQYPGARFELKIIEQYRNMKEILDHYPEVIEKALQAIQNAGVTPILRSIRGGTDGSRLSFMGLPCPNIFAGEHAFHSREEWCTVQDMQKSTATIIHLANLWTE